MPQEIAQTPSSRSSLIPDIITTNIKPQREKNLKKKKRFESRVSTRGITEFWMDILQS